MFMPARDPSFGDGHKQAKHVMGQKQPGLPTQNKQINPADREILQKYGNTPTTLQLSQDREKNAMIRLQSSARTAPHHPLEEGYEQAGSSSLQLRSESTPHATFGPYILQSTQPVITAKPRLLRRSVPGYEPAKRGMGQMQLGQNMDLQKNPAGSARQQEHGNAPTTL